MADLESILQQLKDERDRLGTAIIALTSINGNKPRTKGRRRLGAAARARIAAAQRARWAKARKTKSTPTPAPKRRRMSASARRRIAAAQKARWAKFRAVRR